ncbi:MAG: Zn-ribbon domain-containing OB-fold protein [Candidatus Hodarchaeota archaeon]
MTSEEIIRWKKCYKCGLLQHESHLRCLNCKNEKFALIEAVGKCTLITFTILNAPPAEFRDKPSYALGVVEFENGIKAMGQITTKDNLKIGMILKPVYKNICENLSGKEVNTLVFEPT